MRFFIIRLLVSSWIHAQKSSKDITPERRKFDIYLAFLAALIAPRPGGVEIRFRVSHNIIKSEYDDY